MNHSLVVPLGVLLATACGAGAGADPPRDAGAASPAPATTDAGGLSPGDPVPAVRTTFTATTADLPNPDRGFYGWSGDDFVTQYCASCVKAAYDGGQRLVLAPVQLGAYRTTDLDASWLTALAGSFAAVRAAGMKVTLVFSYDFTAGGNDATSAQIKRHLEQLQPVLAAHADVIPYMRAGFIGAWGEWHSSKAGNSCGYNAGATPCGVANANRVVVRDALLANVPSTTQIGFRSPADLVSWYPSPTQQARAGVHDDCFLQGPDDTGTYASDAERAYVKTLTESASFGGETCDGAQPRSTCADIRREGAEYHLAWLNLAYALQFIDAWRAGGCFDEVSRSIGYRLQLDAMTHPASALRASSVVVGVDLRNVGWARVFGGGRALEVALRHRASGALLVGRARVGLGTLPAQASASTRIDVAIAIPESAALGDYAVLLGAPDPAPALAGDVRFASRFANADDVERGQGWEPDLARLRTGSVLTVR